MAIVTVFEACVGCGNVFSFSPVHVPSIPVYGVRRPVCKECFAVRQAHRKQQGLPIETHHPNAYIGCEEEEVNWG